MDGTCNVQSLFCRAYKKQHIFSVWEGKPQIHAHVPRKDMVSLQVSHRHKQNVSMVSIRYILLYVEMKILTKIDHYILKLINVVEEMMTSYCCDWSFASTMWWGVDHIVCVVIS